jgi:hypothetical protein
MRAALYVRVSTAAKAKRGTPTHSSKIPTFRNNPCANWSRSEAGHSTACTPIARAEQRNAGLGSML